MKTNMVLALIIFFAMISGCCSLFTQEEMAPKADFNADVTSGSAPLTVNFTDESRGGRTSSGSGYYSIQYREWDFGDGTTSSIEDPTHTFAEEGEYSVNLTIRDSNGKFATHSIKIMVYSSDHDLSYPPKSSFTTDRTEGPSPLIIQFTDTSSDNDGTITSWGWDFDDGSTSDQQNPSHTFEEAGTYNVELIVTDNNGFSDSTTKTIEVTGGTISTFNATADTYVDETNPDMNYGQRTYIMVNDDCEIYLKFTGLPAANTIEKAEVKLYNTFRMENGPEVEALTALSHWNENTVTWNNGMTFAIGSLDTTEANGTQQWFSWDVTTGVKNDMSGGLVTVILRAVTSGHAQFFTRENDNIYIPKLELTLSS